MMPSLALCALSLAVAPPATPPAAPAEPAIPLADVHIDLGKLRTSETQVYRVNMKATGDDANVDLDDAATVTLSTAIESGTVVLRDEWRIAKGVVRMTIRCERDAFLTLRRSDVEFDHEGETLTASVTLRGGSALVEHAGNAAELPYPPQTLMQAAVFRLVPLLPRTPGARYAFPRYTESVEIRVQEHLDGTPYTIECVGKETITVAGRSVRCTRYTLDVRHPMDFFVDESSRLRQVVTDDGATVMVLDDTRAATGAERGRSRR